MEASILLVTMSVSSLRKAYWLPLYNSSLIVVEGCSVSESKNSMLGQITCLTTCITVSMLMASSCRIACPETLHKIFD